MNNALKVTGGIVAALACIVGLTMGGGALGLWQMQVFGARTENTRNNIYRHSTAHTEGTVRTIRRYQVEYLQATDESTKKAIATMVAREADNIDDDALPADLYRFVSDARSEQ